MEKIITFPKKGINHYLDFRESILSSTIYAHRRESFRYGAAAGFVFGMGFAITSIGLSLLLK